MPLAGNVSTASFKTDIQDRHLIYSYAVSGAQTESGEDETWRYEIWFFCEDRVVYAIHGGPMAGRKNYQAATYQCIRPGELWQINWLEETGSIVSMVFDICERRISTMISFSKGHWEDPVAAHGDKRNKEDLTRWRKLAEIGHQTDRTMLVEQAELEQDFRGKGDLDYIDMGQPCL